MLSNNPSAPTWPAGRRVAPRRWRRPRARPGQRQAVGTLSLMRIDPANGVIEVGFVSFSPLLKRTRIATEAQFS